MKTNIFLIVVIIILIILGLRECNKNKELQISQEIFTSNLDALRDTVRVERNKEGQIEYTKQSFIAKSEELEKWNKELAAQVKKEKGKVIYIQQASAQIDGAIPSDHVITNTIKVFDNETTSIGTDFDTTYTPDNYRKLSIETTLKLDSSKVKSATTKITKDAIAFNIVTGLKEEGGKLRIMLRSDYPGLSFSKIDGALVDPHKSEVLKKMFPPKKFGMGPVIGYGLTQDMKPGFYVGVGVQYNIIRW